MGWIRPLVAGGIMAVAAMPAAAMDADTFYHKGLALKKRGMGAMFSKDLKPMIAVFREAAKSVKSENKRADEPFYCGEGKPNLSPDQLLTEFAAIPQARRKAMTVRAAWREIAIKRYPC
jgi:hypothetical protein